MNTDSTINAHVAIVGCGLVGRAWAVTFGRVGWQVSLYDESPQACESAREFVASAIPELVRRGLADGAVETNISIASSLQEALEGADYVQESSFEDVEVKRQVFAAMDKVAPPKCILASSSSALVPSSFTEDLDGRHRCLVVHPINPPYLVPAVEVVPAPWTQSDVTERAGAIMRAIGQSPIMMQREIDGFVMNRLQGALLQEAFRLVAQGVASAEDVDIGIRDGLGLRWSFMGPFETIDLNAPQGIRDYVERFGDMYANMAQTQREPVDWKSDDLLNTIEGQRREHLSADQLANRQLWRDQRLMALRAHEQSTSADSPTSD